MLKGIDPILNADVLYALRAMGHGDDLIIADTNFPSDFGGAADGARQAAPPRQRHRRPRRQGDPFGHAARRLRREAGAPHGDRRQAERSPAGAGGGAEGDRRGGGTLLADGLDRALRLLRPRAERPIASSRPASGASTAASSSRRASSRPTRPESGARHGERKRGVAILGVFVADLAFRAGRLPEIGETIIGSGFKLGPGGKGSNQSVAAARVGADVTFISKIGKDEFGAIALATWKKEGVKARVAESADEPTGAAYIFVNDQTGDNAIIVVPGAGGSITPADVDAAADTIRSAAVFVTQLEQPVASGEARARDRQSGRRRHRLQSGARRSRSTMRSTRSATTSRRTRTRRALLTGVPVTTVDDARKAGDVFLKKGVGAALITLGEAGALLHTEAAVDAHPGLQGRAGGGDDRRGRRLQRRLRGGARRAGSRRRRRRASAAPSPASRSRARARRRRCRGLPRSRRYWRAANRFVDTAKRCGILAAGMLSCRKSAAATESCRNGRGFGKAGLASLPDRFSQRLQAATATSTIAVAHRQREGLAMKIQNV